MQDCSDVMQLLLKTQTDMADLADDDPQVSLDFSLTVKAAPHECVIRTSQP